MAEKEGERSQQAAGESDSFTVKQHTGGFISERQGGRFCRSNLTSEEGRRP